MVFEISETELAAADEYEVDDYRRIAVPLRADYPGRAAQVTVVVASWCATTWPSTAISQ
jgi:hypothetical protein